MKIQRQSLLSVKSQFDKLNDLLKAIQESGHRNMLVPTANAGAWNLIDRDHPNVGQSRPPDTRHWNGHQTYNFVVATGIKYDTNLNDMNLRVNMPARNAPAKREVPTGAGSNSQIAGAVGYNNWKPATMRTRLQERVILKNLISLMSSIFMSGI